MNFFSSRSSIYFFSLANSVGAILYWAIDTGLAPGTRSMAKSTSLLGSNPGTSSGNTSEYSSTTGILLIKSIVLFFSDCTIIIKHEAPSASSFRASRVEIIVSPLASRNSMLHCLQSIMTWLFDCQSIPSITSNPSNGKQIRFTLNLRLATSIEHLAQTELVEACLDAGVEIVSSHPKSRTTSPSLLTHSSEMNEWVAPESNNTKTLWSNNKHWSSMRLPDWVASVLVNANTLLAARGRSTITFCYFCYGGVSLVAFLLGYCLT